MSSNRKNNIKHIASFKRLCDDQLLYCYVVHNALLGEEGEQTSTGYVWFVKVNTKAEG